MAKEKLVTPIAPCKFPWIFSPNPKFPPPKFQITLEIEDTPEWKTLLDLCEMRLKEYYQAQCTLSRKQLKLCPHLPWKKDAKEFRFQQTAEGKTREGKTFSCQPRVIGPDMQPLTEDRLEGRLGNGTQVRVGFALDPWVNDAQGVGISARLQVVQIIKPVYYDGNSDYANGGFSAVESDWLVKSAAALEDRPDVTLDNADFLAGLQACRGQKL